jgi:biotin transport system substrate-specific component
MLDLRLVAPQIICGAIVLRRVRSAGASILLILGASAFVAVCAQVSFRLPFTPVPLTLQTLGVLTAGMALGSRGGVIALCLYLAEGAAGLPVFAGGAAGAHHLAGPTGGYLMAYPFAAGLTGYLAQAGWDRRPLGAFSAAVLGTSLILAMGSAWLALFVGSYGRSFALGVLPFVPGDLVKAAMAAGILPACWRGMAYLGLDSGTVS